MSPVRTLAAAQLRADLRHPRTGKPAASRLGMTVLAYGVSGAVLALSLGQASAEAVLFIASSFGMVLAAFGVVGSYDELMGRPKDNAWLATLPATEAQHYAARLVGIAVYVGVMAVSVAIPVGVRAGAGHGAGTGALVGLLVAASVGWTAQVVLAALWGLTLALPQRLLRPAISVTRSLLVALLVLGYQWIGTAEGTRAAAWWPGAWMSDALAGRPTLGLAALAVSSVGLAAAFGGLFPGRYFRLLGRLSAGERQSATGRRTRRLTAPERLLARTGPERAAYGFAIAAFTDDRLVRGRLWPAALLPVGFALFGLVAGGLESLFASPGEAPFLDPATQLHLSVLMVLLFCAQSLVQTLQFSDHAEAAWLFGTLPHARPRALQVGAQQALAVRVLAPLHVVLAGVLALQMPALDAAIHAGFWFAVVALVTRLYALAYRTPPFSRPADRMGAGGRFVPLLTSVPAAVAVVVLQTITFSSRLSAVLVAVGILALAEALGRVTLGKVERPEPRPELVPTA